MKYDPEIHHRRSTRFNGYDYSQGGSYFVTIVTRGREHTLGEILDGEMRLSQAGEMVEQHWRGLPERFPNIDIDEYIVMPNHVHAIVVIREDTAPQADRQTRDLVTLGKIVRAFKALAAHDVRQAGLIEFGWQRNYHDRIIRDENELDNIRLYIVTNPACWDEDVENR